MSISTAEMLLDELVREWRKERRERLDDDDYTEIVLGGMNDLDRTNMMYVAHHLAQARLLIKQANEMVKKTTWAKSKTCMALRKELYDLL